MPVRIKKTKGGKYRVSTPGGTKAKGTSLANAKKQKRLLNAIEHGFKPRRKVGRKTQTLHERGRY